VADFKLTRYEIEQIVENAVETAFKNVPKTPGMLEEQESVVKSFFRGLDSLPNTPYEIAPLEPEEVTPANALFQTLGFAIRASILATSPPAAWYTLYKLAYDTPPPQNFTDLMQQIGSIWGDAAKSIVSDLTDRAKNAAGYAVTKFAIPLLSIPANFLVFGGLNHILAAPVDAKITTMATDPAGVSLALPIAGVDIGKLYQDMEQNWASGNHTSAQRNMAQYLYYVAMFSHLASEGVAKTGLQTSHDQEQEFYRVWNEHLGDTSYKAEDFDRAKLALETLADMPLNSGENEEIIEKFHAVAVNANVDSSGKTTMIAGLADAPGVPLPLIPGQPFFYASESGLAQVDPHRFFDKQGWLDVAWAMLDRGGKGVSGIFSNFIANQWKEDPSQLFSPAFATILQASKGKSPFNTNGSIKQGFLDKALEFAEQTGQDPEAAVQYWTSALAGTASPEEVPQAAVPEEDEPAEPPIDPYSYLDPEQDTPPEGPPGGPSPAAILPTPAPGSMPDPPALVQKALDGTLTSRDVIVPPPDLLPSFGGVADELKLTEAGYDATNKMLADTGDIKFGGIELADLLVRLISAGGEDMVDAFMSLISSFDKEVTSKIPAALVVDFETALLFDGLNIDQFFDDSEQKESFLRTLFFGGPSVDERTFENAFANDIRTYALLKYLSERVDKINIDDESVDALNKFVQVSKQGSAAAVK